MNKNEGLPFKSYSNQLVANLEDADAGVRDTAKKAVVDLFGYVFSVCKCTSPYTHPLPDMPLNTQRQI